MTRLTGMREKVFGEKVVFSIYGISNGKPVNREIPFSMIDMTNIEYFAYAAAMTRSDVTWRILNLFNGNLEIVRLHPEGVEQCPQPFQNSCYRVAMTAPDNEGMFYYTMDGILAEAKGDDALGNYILKPPVLWKQEKKTNGLFKSLTSDPNKSKQKQTSDTSTRETAHTQESGSK